jgi:D-lactate dehydrogenase (cytochrome)
VRPLVLTDPDVRARYLEDAAHNPGGHTPAVALPESEAEVSTIVRDAGSVLAVGAQSSLTGGATPCGETVISTARLTGIRRLAADRVRVGAGVTIAALQDALAETGGGYPPAPTFTGACAGGVVATNAAGAATFKHGATRAWVEGLTIVLASGSALDVVRGEVRAHTDGFFEIEDGHRVARVPIPSYTVPDVPKCSAGYAAWPEMDLIDLFIGSEGTLGIVTDVTFRVLPRSPTACLFFLTTPSEAEGLALVSAIRSASRETWRSGDPRGIDVAAIEHMDARSLAILRADGADRKHGVSWPPDAQLALLVQCDLASRIDLDGIYDDIAGALTSNAADSPVTRICRLFADAGILDRAELAAGLASRRTADFLAIREAVPTGVNRRVAEARRVDPRIAKTAADMIVPYSRFADLLARSRAAFEGRGLDYAVWGHISDGNVHPNVLPRSFADVEMGRQAILELGREVVRLGGSPLAEHGVGRNSGKQALLRELYGHEGIQQMRAVKRAMDPAWKLAPGVVFEP